METTLDRLRVGESATVSALRTTGALRQRLMDAAKSLQLDTVYLMQQREGE